MSDRAMVEKMTKDELIEALADIEHQRWSDWQIYVHESGIRGAHTRQLCIDRERVDHWNRLIDTPYTDLPEHSKQADREQVMRYWPLIVEFVAQYMENFYGRPDLEFRMPTEWREEMGNA